MNEFVRGPIWASADAQRTWEPRVRAAADVWVTLERESVYSGLRSSGLLLLTPFDFIQEQMRAAAQGLSLIALAAQPLGLGAYSAGQQTDGPQGMRCALTRDAAAWREAWQSQDDEKIGSLLGYPECCRRFFSETWGKGQTDPVPEGTVKSIECNTMLRWLGLRLVPHLPCRVDCAASVEQGRGFAALGEQLGFHQAVEWMRELLALPLTYSSLHGIGTVVTPVFKFEFSSDYRAVERRIVLGGKIADSPVRYEPMPWEDNGFTTARSMLAAHTVVAMAFGKTRGHVLDLGCGDGTLIERLRARNNLEEAAGVEQDQVRVERAKVRHPSVSFTQETIQEWASSPVRAWDAILLMPGRLLEMEIDSRLRVIQTLRESTKKLVVYAYADWILDGLEALCLRSGLPKPIRIVHGQGVAAQAGIVCFD